MQTVNANPTRRVDALIYEGANCTGLPLINVSRARCTRARARIRSAGSSPRLSTETRARKTDALLKGVFLGLHILVQRDIAGRVGVLGQLLPEIRREGLRYLVRYTFTRVLITTITTFERRDASGYYLLSGTA